MSTSHRSPLRSRTGRTVAGVSALAWVLTGPGAVGVASAHTEGDVQVQNTETVQVYTDASGEVDTSRVYEQLVLTGEGDVEVANPVSTDNLRNLDGFAGFDIEDGAEQVSTSVDGQERMRSVSNYTDDLPLEVSATYLLDGKEVSPGDVVGESGDLEVKYHVENVTGETEQLEVSDGMGGTVTKSVDVVLPMVGSLTTVLPSNFTDVESAQANIAGDGRGGTKMTFTMTLVPPIGAATADFGYRARITSGVIPDATLSALPVSPLESSSLKTGAESYQGGAETGADLTAGASEIDANLLKLRDGAADLTVGLMKLYDGAGQLSAGLNNDAVPGTQQLADGSNQLSDGASRLYAGSGDLVGGLHQLRDGTGDLLGGTRDLHDGALRIRDGASDLDDGAVRLRDGVSDVNDGAVKLRNGAGDLNAGAVRLHDGIATLDSGAGDLSAGAKDLRDGIKLIRSGVQSLPTQLQTDPRFLQLKGALQAVSDGIGTPNSTDPNTLLGGLNLIRYGLRSPGGPGNCDVRNSDADPQNDCGVGDGAQFLEDELRSGATSIFDPSSPGADSLYLAAIGAYDYAVQTAPLVGLSCPARPAPTQANPVPLPPAQALGMKATNPGCYAAAVSAYGYNAPAGVFPAPFDEGGVRTKSLAAADALQDIQDGIGGLNDTGSTTLIGGLNTIKYALNNPNFSEATCDQDTSDANPVDDCGVAEVQALVSGGVDLLVQGISDQLTGVLTTAYQGSNKLYKGTLELTDGTGQLVDGSNQLADGSKRLADGTLVLADGTRQLADGTIVLTDGTRRLADGTIKLADGTQQLSDGATQLDDGAVQLDTGGMELRDGAGQLDDGSGRLDDGLQQLLSGLTDAADGSNQLRDGLRKASEGAPQISDGATELSKKGTKKLIAAGSDTTVEFGTKYAELEAGADRAEQDSMAFGAPEGAQGLTAYTYEIRGEDGEGSRNWGRGIAAIGVFGLGAGVYALRRRFV